MTPEQFCYWLKGYIDLAEARLRVPLPEGEKEQLLDFTWEQVREIKSHLSLLFKPAIYLPPEKGFKLTPEMYKAARGIDEVQETREGDFQMKRLDEIRKNLDK